MLTHCLKIEAALSRTKVGFLLIGLAISQPIKAFELGTLFIIDVVKTAEIKSATGRIAISSTVLSKGKLAKKIEAPQLAKKSDFEIDFTKIAPESTQQAPSFIAPTAGVPQIKDSQMSFGTPAFGSEINDSTISVFEQ